jgi:hypothetical protein
MLVVGSFLGAGVIGKVASLGIAVLVSGGIKAVISVTFLFNRKENEYGEK